MAKDGTHSQTLKQRHLFMRVRENSRQDAAAIHSAPNVPSPVEASRW